MEVEAIEHYHTHPFAVYGLRATNWAIIQEFSDVDIESYKAWSYAFPQIPLIARVATTGGYSFVAEFKAGIKIEPQID